MIELDGREQSLARLALALSGDGEAIEKAVREALAAGATTEETRGIARVVDVALDGSSHASDLAERALAPQDPGPWTSRSTHQVRGHQTQVVRREGSSRTTVVLCHSLGTDHRMWEPLVTALSADIDVIAYDVRNHGPERDATREFSIPECAVDLLALLDDLRLSKIYLAGISMGGAITQEVAAQASERLVGMSLMACRGKGGPTGEERAEAAERDGLEAQVGVTLSRWLSAPFLAENGPWVRYLRQRVVGWNVEAWAGGWRGLGSSNTIGRLAGFPASTLCIAGTEDSSCPPAVLQGLVDVLPHASISLVPGPHLFALEQPAVTASLIEGHLSSVS